MPSSILASGIEEKLKLDIQRVQIVRERLAQHDRRLQILEQGGQGPDHPVHPAIPETRYLKAFYCRVV